MADSEQKLRAKIEQFRSKKEVIKAQYSAAEAQVRISEAATGVGEEMADVGLAMQRALDKTENMKARADAVQELEAAGTFDDITALGPGEDDIDRQLKELSSTSEVDTDLAKMKAELGIGSSPPAGQLGAGGTATQSRPEPAGRPERRAGAVIVRISTEGQYELAESDVEELNELDNRAVAACDTKDEEQFRVGVQRAAGLRAQARLTRLRRQAGGFGGDPASAGCLPGGGQGGVQRRGPDPRIAPPADCFLARAGRNILVA